MLNQFSPKFIHLYLLHRIYRQHSRMNIELSYLISSSHCVSVNTVHTLHDAVCLCSGGEYLAVLRQDHRLGVAELLLEFLLGVRVMEAGVGIADSAQSVRGGGALHALHRCLRSGSHVWVSVERWNRQTREGEISLIHCVGTEK